MDEIITGARHLSKKQTSEQLRYNLVAAFLDAMHISCSRKNICKGFLESGIIPISR
jgi:hypothetical protein